MNLYVKQKVFSWGDKFNVYDENGQDVFRVKGEVFSLGKKLHVYNLFDEEIAFIHQKVLSFLPKYYISRGGTDIAEVKKHFTLFKQEYSVEGLGWSIHGNFFAHEYEIAAAGRTVASISKHWFTWGDTYEIKIDPAEDPVNVLCAVLVIDACLQQAQSASN